MEFDWPERDSREWLLGPRGAELEPWADAERNLPDADRCVAAVLCVANTPPTIWMREEAIDHLELWDTLRAAVQGYDAGDRDDDVWRAVLGGEGHLLLLGR